MPNAHTNPIKMSGCKLVPILPIKGTNISKKDSAEYRDINTGTNTPHRWSST